MRHPLSAIAPQRRGRVFWPLALAAAALTAILQIIDAPLKAAGKGIIDFELARTVSTAGDIVRLWTHPPATASPLTLAYAGLSLGLDYLYMPVYALAIALACIGVADMLRARAWPLAGLGLWLAWGVWLAALCDATENFAMLQSLLHGAVEPWPLVAFICAVVKFAFVIAGLLYALLGLVAWVAARPKLSAADRRPQVKVTSAHWPPAQKR